MPAVPEFAGDERPAKRRRRTPGSRSSRSGPVSKKTPGGTVVTFPPQSAPSWSDPSTTIADRDPLNQPIDDFRPVEIGPPGRVDATPDPSPDSDSEMAVEPEIAVEPTVSGAVASVAPEAPLAVDHVQTIDNDVVDHDHSQDFATETAPVPATAPRPEATEPPTLFPDQPDPELDFDESQRLFTAQTIDVAPDRLTIHFSEVTGPLPSSVTAQPESAGQQPPSVMDLTDSLSDTGHIAEDHDGQPDRDQSKESDQELDALLAELSAVSESSEIVEQGDAEATTDSSPTDRSPVEDSPAIDTPVIDSPPDDSPPDDSPPDDSPAIVSPVESPRPGAVDAVPEITPPQPPENFSALLKPPSVLSPQDTAVIYGLPGQPTDTPVGAKAEAPKDVLPKVGPRRVVPSKQPTETRFEDAVSPRRPIAPPGTLAKQQEQAVPELDLDSLPPPSPEQYFDGPSPHTAPDTASARTFDTAPGKTPETASGAMPNTAADKAPEKATAEVFGSETSVFPAIKTRRGDVVEPGQAEGSWFTRSAELPYIRVEDSEPEVAPPRRRWLRYTFLVLLVLAIAAVAIVVALQPSGTLPFLNN